MNGLLVHNQGDVPTFEVVRGQRTVSSFIDVTLTLGVDYLLDWHVSRAFNASDHNSIHFQIPVAPLPFKEVRPWKSAKWDLFKTLLDKPFHPPETMSKKKLDKLTASLVSDIQSALDKTCPVFVAQPKVVANRWFTSSHKKLLIKVRNQYRLHKRFKGQESVRYYALLNKYKRKCKNAKKQSWHKYVSDTPSETHMSHLSQLIQHRQKNKLNFLEKADQSGLTSNGSETIQELARKHFPQATDVPTDEKYDSLRNISSSSLHSLYDYVTPDLVKRSLSMFKPHKAPGPDGFKPIIFCLLYTSDAADE